MGNYLLKPDPDEDFYVEWTSYTDCPIAYGNKEEFQNYNPKVYTDKRFERTDRTGTSAYLGDGSYETKELWMYEQGINGPWILPRKHLKAYAIEAVDLNSPHSEETEAVCQKYCTPLIHED